MKKYLKILYLIIVLGLTQITYSQGFTLSQNAKVSVLTCGTSDQLHSLFGHTGIRIQDLEKGFDYVYNYGAFDFSEPNFYGRFIKGDLLYFIGLDDFNSFLFNYRVENRSVWEQELNLDLNVKQAIFNELASTYGTKKALYTYKFIDKNCTTLAKELIEKHAGFKLNTNIIDSDNSNRVILNEYLKNAYFPGFGINLAFGLKTDKKFDHIFLPNQLLESIEKTSINNSKLSNNTIEHFKAVENTNSSLPTILGLITAFVILGLLTIYKPIASIFYVLLGLFSLFIFGLQLYSNHAEVHLNYNLLLINPLYIVLAFYLITDQFNKFRFILKIIVCCSIIYIVITVFNSYIFMVLPIVIGILISLLLQFKLYKKA